MTRARAGTRALAYLMVGGLAAATTIRVSNQLGAAQPAGARRSLVTAMGLGLLVCAFGCALPLWVARRAWVGLFTGDAGVGGLVLDCFPAMLASLLGDAADALLGGALKGAGRQRLASFVTLASYWVVGLPLAAALGLRWGRGAVGLMEGLAVASTGQGLVLGAAVAQLDWQAEASTAQRRLQGVR